MTTLETRNASFVEVKKNLGERQKMIYELLKNHTGGASATELAMELFNKGLTQTPERNSVHPRLNELVSIGLVEVIGKQKCNFSNRKVAIYKVRFS